MTFAICENCQKPVMPGASADTRKLGGVCPSDGMCAYQPKPETKPVSAGNVGARRGTSEKLLVARIVHVLESRGCVVIQTGQRKAKGAGNTVGAPDLFATRSVFHYWIGMEVKTAEGRPSKEQQELIDAGKVFLVRNEQQALDAMGLE